VENVILLTAKNVVVIVGLPNMQNTAENREKSGEPSSKVSHRQSPSDRL
jgi:hypothetical protein